MAEILWMIGEKEKATVVIPGEIAHIAHSHRYFQDTVTEKVCSKFYYVKYDVINLNYFYTVVFIPFY